MNKLTYSLIALSLLLVSNNTFSNQSNNSLVISSEISKSYISAKKKTYSKSVWSIIEVDQKINHPLFFPLNEKIPACKNLTNELILSQYNSEKESIKWNLWTILFANIVQGNLSLYCPFDPEWENTVDNGYLSFPLVKKNDTDNYQTSPAFKKKVMSAGCLGLEFIDPFDQPIKSIVYPDEDSLIVGKDGKNIAVYPAPDYVWFQDKDIISYKIKEEWEYSESGMVIDKKISSIAPIVNRLDQNGNIVGERALFWADFTEVEPILTAYFTHSKRAKKDRILSLASYFMERGFYADEILGESSLMEEGK